MIPTFLFPFVVGAFLGYCFGLYTILRMVYLHPYSLQDPWEYESEYGKVLARLRRLDWNWYVLLFGPTLVGAVLWLCWWALALPMGVSL